MKNNSENNAVTLLTPRRAGLSAGEQQVVDVLVRIQAPDAPEDATAQRPPQAVSLVVDRSGSMSGRPLAEAQRCAEFLVSRLRNSDMASLVQFDHRVERMWPAVTVGNGNSVRQAIRRIHAGGNTDLHGGWLEGAKSLEDVPGKGLKRVILLSDGCANTGVTDSADIAAQCASFARFGISTSTYGLGNSFNEDLMVAMARAGGGNHYYGDTADDLMEPFEQELDLLSNLCIRNVRLELTAPAGTRYELLNELPASGKGWVLPDLAWGAESWALVRVTVSGDAMPEVGRSMEILRASVFGQTLAGDELSFKTVSLSIPVLTHRSAKALSEDELVQRRCTEVSASKDLTRIQLAAENNDWVTVGKLLAIAQQQYAGNAWVSSILDAMTEIAQSQSRERMMKEARYSSAKLSRRLAARDESASMLMAADAAEVPAFLRRKSLQGKKDL